MKFVRWLTHGETLGENIEILMGLADEYCPEKATELARGGDTLKGQAALETIGAVLKGEPQAAASLRRPIISDLCGKHHAIKKYVKPALEFVDWLPYGSTIAKLIRVLMRLADAIY